MTPNTLTLKELKISLDRTLKKYTFFTLAQVEAMYNLPGRYYHNFGHVMKMVRLTHETNHKMSKEMWTKLMLAILFHDIIYLPGSDKNEISSARLFEFSRRPEMNKNMAEEISMAIIVTDYKKYGHTKAFDVSNGLAVTLKYFDLFDLFFATKTVLKNNFRKNFFEWKNIVSLPKFYKGNLELIKRILVEMGKPDRVKIYEQAAKEEYKSLSSGKRRIY